MKYPEKTSLWGQQVDEWLPEPGDGDGKQPGMSVRGFAGVMEMI